MKWKYNADNHLGFLVERTGGDGPQVFRLGRGRSGLRDKGMAFETEYCYEVRDVRVRGVDVYGHRR